MDFKGNSTGCAPVGKNENPPGFTLAADIFKMTIFKMPIFGELGTSFVFDFQF
jgi:hypothetical protein